MNLILFTSRNRTHPNLLMKMITRFLLLLIHQILFFLLNKLEKGLVIKNPCSWQLIFYKLHQHF